MIKLTGGQRIDLLGVRKEDLPAVWADLDMPSGYAYGKSFRTVKTCVGTDFCRFGVGDSTALGIAIEERYQGHRRPGEDEARRHRLPPQLCRGAVQGPRRRRRRGRPVGDLRRRRGGGARPQGRPPGHRRHRRQVITLTGRFLQYYRENANWLERTYAWVPRVGIEKIRAVVVDDAEGIAADLDATCRSRSTPTSIRGSNGRKPVTPGSSAPRCHYPLPQVPVR